MEFVVLDKQTIQCVMSEKEIADYGMDKRTIYQNDARTADFFRQVMHRAQQETGFVKKGKNIAVHAAFLADESLEITFSVDEEQAAAGLEVVVLKSDSLFGMADFCRKAGLSKHTSLYIHQGSYFLLAQATGYEVRDAAALLCLADEYIDGSCCIKSMAAYIMEHGRCMLKGNAAKVLSSL